MINHNKTEFFAKITKIMIILWPVCSFIGSLLRLLFYGLLLPIYAIIAILYFFVFIKTKKDIATKIFVAVIILFSLINYKYILDTGLLLSGNQSVEVGEWREISDNYNTYIMVKNKPVKNTHVVGTINNKIFYLKRKLMEGNIYKIEYLPNTNTIIQVQGVYKNNNKK